MVPALTITVPAVRVSAAIEANVSAGALAVGAGHYPTTGWPGSGRTVGLAGHDVTHHRTFGPLRAARKGDLVYIAWGGRVFVYRITGQRVVAPTDVRVLDDVGVERLVMTTCYPPGSARSRLVTFARRVSFAVRSRWLPIFQGMR